MAASTPSMCLRRASDSVHSQTSTHACSRVGVTTGRVSACRPEPSGEMASGTLAEPLDAPTWAAARMEKFVIEGGTPLSGTVIPAGNKNAALPALAAPLAPDRHLA